MDTPDSTSRGAPEDPSPSQGAPVDSAPTERPPARPAWKWLRRVLVAAFLLGAGYLGVAFALSRFLDPVRLADWMEPRLAAATNREVRIGTADVRILPFGLRMRDVEVADPTGQAQALARVGTIGLSVELLPLLRREVRVDKITIEGLEADLRIDADGRSNFGDMSPAEAEAEEEREAPEAGDRPFSLDLRGIRVEGGRVSYVSARDSLAVELGGLEARSAVARAADGPWSLEGSAGGSLRLERGGRPAVPDGTSVQLTFDVEADPEFQAVRILAGSLRLDEVAFALGGSVSELDQPVRQVSLDLSVRDLPLPRIVTLLPDSVRRRVGDVAGTLGAELSVRGELGPDRRPDVTGQATLAGVRLRTPEGVVVAEGVAGEVAIAADRSLSPRMTGTVLGGATSVDGRATVGERGSLDLNVRANPDLARLASVAELPEGVTLAGRLAADVRVTGPTGDPRALRFAGELRGTDVRATHPELGVPVAVSDGRVRLDGTTATFQDFPVALGEDRLVATGEVRDVYAFLEADRTPYLRGSVRGPHLSLVRLRAEPPPDTTLTYGRIAFAQVGGRSVRGRAPQDAAREMGLQRPDSLPLAGLLEVRLDTLVDRRGTTESVRAQIEFGPRFVRVTDATFRRYGGEMRSGFNLALGADATQPFTFRLEARDVDAGAFLSATTPLGRLVRGTITVEIDVTGGLDGLLLPTRPSLVGTGRFLVAGGGLRATPVTERLATFLGLDALREPTLRNWGTSFVLENGTFRLADAVVDGPPGTPRVGGGIGLDGGLDLLAAFDLPAGRLDTSALDRLGVVGEVATRVRERNDVVQAVMRIGGNVTDPALRADPAAPARTVVQAVQDETQQEVRRQIDERRRNLEDRASGFVRGLLQRPAAARPGAADTVPRDTARAGAVRPDTIRPDSARPDSARRDTIPPDAARGTPGSTGAPRPDSARRDTIPPAPPA